MNEHALENSVSNTKQLSKVGHSATMLWKKAKKLTFLTRKSKNEKK